MKRRETDEAEEAEEEALISGPPEPVASWLISLSVWRGAAVAFMDKSQAQFLGHGEY